MLRRTGSIFLLLSTLASYSQSGRFEQFLADSTMTNASVSFFVTDADSGKTVLEFNRKTSLIPASTMKLVTSSVALELLGPYYKFATLIGYTGTLNKRSGRLKGNIVIKGGGDPALGSQYFPEHYKDFISDWAEEIYKAGIRKVTGKIITDDSYYDYEPVAPRWLWEDLGTYYGAGVYGLSAFDNSSEIRVISSPDSAFVELRSVAPELKGYHFTNRLIASGSKPNWYVYAAPYSKIGWLSGTIPVTSDEIILETSIPDPPYLIASMLHEKLEVAGIKIAGKPSTLRLEPEAQVTDFRMITETASPLLASIIDVLNKESVNLFAEHLVKEMGKQFRNSGTTAAGLYVIRDFLSAAGIDTTGLFLEDGSGLSARNGLNSESLVQLLDYIRNKGKYFSEFYSSLPDAGRNGTLSLYFRDPVFESNLKAKSGSMTRVRCYAGYFRTSSGRNMVFSIMINNFQGPSSYIISNIEEVLREIILYR